MQVNNITFAGNVGVDPTTSTTTTGMTYTKFSLCNKYKNKDKETNTWVNVIGWGNVAEWMIAIKKGDNIVVTGMLGVQQYEKDGEKRTSVQISAQSFGIIEKRQATNKDNKDIDLNTIPF